MPRRADAISALFRDHVVVETGVPGSVEGELFPEELKRVERAVEKRRFEFAAGRLLARRALQKLEFAPTAILPAEDRSPIWPAGIVGTITHTRELCAVAVARATDSTSLGLDVEQAKPLKDELSERICNQSEISWMRDVSNTDEERGRLGKLFFSAKEAFYKCQYPLTGRFLEFHDVEVVFDTDAQTFTTTVIVPDKELPPGLQLTSRYLLLDDLIVCAVEGL